MDLIRDKPIPKTFESLTSLRRLDFTGGTAVKYIGGNLFRCFQSLNISEIHLSGLGVGRIDHDALFPFGQLSELDLSDNPALGMHLLEIADYLKNSSVRVLRLNNVFRHGDSVSANFVLQGLCGLNVTEMYLDHNQITHLDPIFSTCFPNVRILSLSNNFLTPKHSLTDDIFHLKQLVGLDISCQYGGYGCSSDWKRFPRSAETRDSVCVDGMTCPFLLPPSLEWINVSHNGLLNSALPANILMKPSKLKRVIAAFCGLQVVPQPTYCARNVVPQVQTFDVRMNYLQCVNESFFKYCNWTSVTEILLGGNRLGEGAGKRCNNDSSDVLGFLRPVSSLKHLDLSDNKLESFHNLSPLKDLAQLRLLNFSRNKFTNVSTSLASFIHLEHVDFSFNQLECLSNQTTVELHNLKARKGKHVSVDLTGNLLSCSCHCFHFFEWLETTDVIFLHNGTYRCQFDDGSQLSLKRLPYVVVKLQHLCYGSAWFPLFVASAVFIFAGITAGSLSFRLRHDIRYIILRMRFNQRQTRPEAEYMFSAFVSCDHRDAKSFIMKRLLPTLETSDTRLNFCVAQRNFCVGATIMDNIIKAIDKSRNVIFIVSIHFLRSKWCREELLIAHQVSV